MYIDNLTIAGLIIAIGFIAGFIAGLIRLTRRDYGQRPQACGD